MYLFLRGGTGGWNLHEDSTLLYHLLLPLPLPLPLPLSQVLSLRDQLRESGSGTDGHLPGSLSQPSLSLSSYSRPSSYTTSLGGYPSLSSTLPPYPSSLPPLSTSTLPAYPSSLPPLSSAPSLEPFKLSFSLPSASATTSVSATSADYSDSSFNRDDGTH